jgi:hypothetical protein
MDLKESYLMATSMKELQAENDELNDTIDQARSTLEDAYTPEATRADLVAAVSQALDLLSGEEEEDDSEEDDQD